MKRDDVLRILAEHRNELREKFGVKSLALFGSVARDKTKDTSDVDLLIEFDRSITLFDLVAVQRHLENLLGVDKVDLVMRDAIFPAIRKDILEEAVDVS